MEPQLIIKDGEYFVTDGEIDGSKFIVMKQPSRRTVEYLHNFFADQARDVALSQKEEKQ